MPETKCFFCAFIFIGMCRKSYYITAGCVQDEREWQGEKGNKQWGGMYEIRAEKQFNVVLNGIDCFYDISVL